jgi:hypothetical protein
MGAYRRTDQFNLGAGLSQLTRTGPLTEWSRPQPVNVKGPNGQTTDIDTPWINSDGTRLYFSFYGAEPGVHEARLQAGAFGPSRLIGFGVGTNRAPVLSFDELRVYFASAQARPGGQPSVELVYTAFRKSIEEPFGQPDFVNALNDGMYRLLPSWLSADGCTMLLWGEETDASHEEIYITHKPPF